MDAAIATLPVLGLGASLSLGSRPDPVELLRTPGGPSFVEYAGLADISRVRTDVQRIRDAGATVLFHPSYINFCGGHPNHASWLQATAQHLEAVGSPWFAQDCAYCFWGDHPGYSSQFGYFVPPILSRSSLEAATLRIREVQRATPVPVAIEPPPVTFVAGDMAPFEFFGALADAADCAILLDMGHLVSYEMATGVPVTDAIDALPARRVIEVHVAGGELLEGDAGPIYIDAHEREVLDETWAMLGRMLPRLPNLKALCLECEGVAESRVLSTLAKLRSTALECSASGDFRVALTAGS